MALGNFKFCPLSQRNCPTGLEWTIFETNWTVLKVPPPSNLYFYDEGKYVFFALRIIYIK